MEDEKQYKPSKERIKSQFEESIHAWILDYLRDQDKADDLTRIIMYHSRREFKARMRMGFMLGVIIIFILLKWLS